MRSDKGVMLGVCIRARLNRPLKKGTADLSTPLRSGRDDKFIAEAEVCHKFVVSTEA
jgi:hypothetical protein